MAVACFSRSKEMEHYGMNGSLFFILQTIKLILTITTFLLFKDQEAIVFSFGLANYVHPLFLERII